jgi:hypothetical protein
MEFFEFSQNNSGGSFVVNDKLCHQVIIEAHDYEEAVYIAERLGCYWDGVDCGMDCPCCGDRWSKYWEKALEFPMDYGKVIFTSVEEYVQYLADNYGFTDPDCRIFYRDGTVKEFFTNKANSIWR